MRKVLFISNSESNDQFHSAQNVPMGDKHDKTWSEGERLRRRLKASASLRLQNGVNSAYIITMTLLESLTCTNASMARTRPWRWS